MRLIALTLAGSVGIACSHAPPAPVAPRTAAPVSAPARRTWDTAVDVLVSRGVPIRSMERATGHIVTDQVGVKRQQGLTWADCGGVLGRVHPDAASYEVFVLGDSAASTVKVTVRWGSAVIPRLKCTSLNVVENEMEGAIRVAAETAAPAKQETPVNAPAGRTWDAVVDEFIAQGIAIGAVERASGFVGAGPLGVPSGAGAWADCHRSAATTSKPDRVVYYVFARGDGGASTVSVTARWMMGGLPADPSEFECTTKGVRERELEAAIRLRAETAQPRDATPVRASLGRTWDAVVAAFASRHIPIRTMNRASGFIATDHLLISRQESERWGKVCGTSGVLGLKDLYADHASYAVFVRGDSAASTVAVSMHLTQGGTFEDPLVFECPSVYVREPELAAAITRAAERTAP
ncbi:MAG TPA: hypothetical protein VGQ29_05265 [Gemmatimonadales bacterium]|jgi:hypothetical protein|nr:hypothetical protein [Gemmatimonadales bacterium]